MDTQHCEVIGCPSGAQWKLLGTRDGHPVEQYLCHQHWRQALADPTLRVERWSRAAPDEPGSGRDEGNPAA